MSTITLTLDKPSKKYNVGETVHCTVQITVNQCFKAQSLALYWRGIAETEWKKSRHEEFKAEQVFFETREFLKGSEVGNPVEFLPGNYEYQSSFTLPPDLATSIKYEYGMIYYSVTTCFDIPNWFNKLEAVYFEVIPQRDLKFFPKSALPVKNTEEKIFGCLWCKTGPMQLTLSLPKQGFIIGELIPITVEVDNNSGVEIKAVQIKLIEKLKFTARLYSKEKCKYTSTTIMKHTFDAGVAPFQNKLFQTSFLLNPDYEWKLLNRCGIIFCDYIIKVIAKPDFRHKNTSVEAKINIGTIWTLPKIETESITPTFDN